MTANRASVVPQSLNGGMGEEVTWVKIEVESEQVPRRYYDIVASISERLDESGVPQSDIDRALDKIERIIVQALGCAEEDTDETDEDSDSDDEDDDGSEEEESA